jgi:hypothetical protein
VAIAADFQWPQEPREFQHHALEFNLAPILDSLAFGRYQDRQADKRWVW